MCSRPLQTEATYLTTGQSASGASRTADEYVIDEIGAATTVKAVFKENTKNTLTGVVSPESRGKLVYTLYDIYGNVLEENQEYTGALEMYKGESIDSLSRTGSWQHGSRQWVIDGRRWREEIRILPQRNTLAARLL